MAIRRLLERETFEERFERGKCFVKHTFGVDDLLEEQELVIRKYFNKKNIYFSAPSGYGKSLVFQALPFLEDSIQDVPHGTYTVIVVSRLKSLIHDQVSHLKSLQINAVELTDDLSTILIISTVMIAITDPNLPFIQVLFEVVSAFATVGLSTGITASLSSLGKVILIITMYIGRVGILLLMSSIFGDPRPTQIHYPEENLLVG